MGMLHQLLYQRITVRFTGSGWYWIISACLLGAAALDHLYVDQRYRRAVRTYHRAQQRLHRERWLRRQSVGHPAFIKAVDLTVDEGLPAYHATVTIYRLERRITSWGSPTLLDGAAA